MEMTFDEYISNPMGRKNAVYSNREMYRSYYRDKLDKILVRETGKIIYRLYKTKNNKFYVYMKIPSELIEKFYYDVVIEFYTDKDVLKGAKTLKDYYVKFYSNDPSFVFTFAHAMKSNNLFIEDLSSKMSKRALKELAEEKNPKDEVGYVKSIFFTYLLMKQYGLFEKVVFNHYAEKYNKKELLSLITHADKKIEDRIEEGNKLSKSKKINKKREVNKQKEVEANITPSTTLSNNIKNTKHTKSISKKSKMVKKTKVK